MTKQYIVTLTNDLKPLASANFKIEAVDGSYKDTFEGIPIASEAASRALLLRHGVAVTHIDVGSWSSRSTEWYESVINSALERVL